MMVTAAAVVVVVVVEWWKAFSQAGFLIRLRDLFQVCTVQNLQRCCVFSSWKSPMIGEQAAHDASLVKSFFVGDFSQCVGLLAPVSALVGAFHSDRTEYS